MKIILDINLILICINLIFVIVIMIGDDVIKNK